MVRRNRRPLSHALNAHSVVSRAKSAQKIGNLDCPLLFGRTEDQTQEQSAREINLLSEGLSAIRSPESAILLEFARRGGRLAGRFHTIRRGHAKTSSDVGCAGGRTPLVVDRPIRAPQSQVRK
jgi:hypothetical protein